MLQRWQDFVGTSDAFRTIERWYSLAVDRIGGFFTGRPAPVREVETEIEAGLHAVVVDAAETAATRTWSHLGSAAPELRAQSDPALASAEVRTSRSAPPSWSGSGRPSSWRRSRTPPVTSGWRPGSCLLRAQRHRRRAHARRLRLHHQELTGGEIAIAGGSAVVGQVAGDHLRRGRRPSHGPAGARGPRRPHRRAHGHRAGPVPPGHRRAAARHHLRRAHRRRRDRGT
ncbi:hypothetical protein QP028_05000 [Corynebacterium suedekumii]|nr:hypothetical protein QP028_05000 [Corynebacterium suedekumii]